MPPVSASTSKDPGCSGPAVPGREPGPTAASIFASSVGAKTVAAVGFGSCPGFDAAGKADLGFEMPVPGRTPGVAAAGSFCSAALTGLDVLPWFPAAADELLLPSAAVADAAGSSDAARSAALEKSGCRSKGAACLMRMGMLWPGPSEPTVGHSWRFEPAIPSNWKALLLFGSVCDDDLGF